MGFYGAIACVYGSQRGIIRYEMDSNYITLLTLGTNLDHSSNRSDIPSRRFPILNLLKRHVSC